MNYLFSLVALLTMLVPQNKTLPDEFYQLPESIRENATLIVSGTYGQGRTPCMFMPDGTRRWGIDSWFSIKRVYRGQVSGRLIRINSMMLPKTGYVSGGLERDHKYLVLLRPGKEKMQRIKTGEATYWDALHDEEIIAIVELKP